MSRVASVPAPNDVLCEHCGYTLNGLPDDGRCPECGEPVADSTTNDLRVPPTFECEGVPAISGFARTSASVIFQPTEFFRMTTTRSRSGGLRRATIFARIHWFLSALMSTVAVLGHATWYNVYIVLKPNDSELVIIGSLLVLPLVFFALDWVTRLAAKLTAWEAAYRGIRLPYDSVLRALHYHAAHYLPVAFVGMMTVVVYQSLLASHRVGYDSGIKYLYVLCGEVIIGAFYLFHTYWIAMRKMMYANR